MDTPSRNPRGRPKRKFMDAVKEEMKLKKRRELDGGR